MQCDYLCGHADEPPHRLVGVREPFRRSEFNPDVNHHTILQAEQSLHSAASAIYSVV